MFRYPFFFYFIFYIYKKNKFIYYNVFFKILNIIFFYFLKVKINMHEFVSMLP